MDLSGLNEEQAYAVMHGKGPLLVLSAAGSGKTRVLTYRAAYLIERFEVEPAEILLGTFTKKAAAEMIERVGELVGVAAESIHAGTLHSLFLRILRTEGYPWDDFGILDEYGQKRMLRDLLGRGSSADLAEVIGRISLWKNDLVDPRDAYRDDPYVARIFAEYEREKASQRVLDFDDMLTRAVELFEREPVTLERYRARTPWLLVDEAQDTSTAQWRLLEMLAGGGGSVGGAAQDPAPGNLTVVADWRQAIYSWRGARPEMVLDFERRFPGSTVVGLPRNYRSTPEIVDAANVLIRHAGRELDDMIATRPGGVTVPLVTIAESPTVEAENVVAEIRTRLAEGDDPSDFAVLYRVNAYSLAFEEALAGAGIPYVVVGSSGFFGRKEIADIVAYLSFVHDPNDEEALRRIVNRPTRFLGRAYCDAVVDHARSSGRTLRDALVPPRLNARQRENAEDFRWHLDTLVGLERERRPLRTVIRAIRDGFGYDRWLLREDGSGAADENRLENLDELEAVASRYDSLESFLSYVAMQRSKSQSNETAGRVQLLTIHRAKGLEWPIVFVAGFAEEVIPHRRSTSPAELEEERRLAYVAITRARDELFVSCPTEWLGRSLTPSRFVYEAELVENDTAVETMAGAS